MDPYEAAALKERPDARALEQMRGCATADVSDALVALGVRNHVLRGVGLVSALDAASVVGCAVTLDFAPTDGTHDFTDAPFISSEAIRRGQPGDVLVMSAKGSPYAFWGAHMAQRARDRGLAAGVVDGGIRDRRAIRELGFPVFAASVTPETMLPHVEAVAYNTRIACGGAAVSPGDVVIGDEDGVVVVPRSRLEELVVELKRRQELETWISEAVDAGTPAHTIYAEVLRRSGSTSGSTQAAKT
jgi:regulator of RNase E activity RraA